MIRKKFRNFKAYFDALFAILQHQTVTPLVCFVDGTWDAIMAFVAWIVAQYAASFKCSCSKKLPCNPMFIPGIEDLLEMPSIRRNGMRENSRNDNDSLPSADTIPMALPEE